MGDWRRGEQCVDSRQNGNDSSHWRWRTPAGITMGERAHALLQRKTVQFPCKTCVCLFIARLKSSVILRCRVFPNHLTISPQMLYICISLLFYSIVSAVFVLGGSVRFYVRRHSFSCADDCPTKQAPNGSTRTAMTIFTHVPRWKCVSANRMLFSLAHERVRVRNERMKNV